MVGVDHGKAGWKEMEFKTNTPRVFFGQEEVKCLSGSWELPFEPKGSVSFSGTFDPPGEEWYLNHFWRGRPEDCEFVTKGLFRRHILSFLVKFTEFKDDTIHGSLLSRVEERFEYTMLSKSLLITGWIGYWILFVWLAAFWKV